MSKTGPKTEAGLMAVSRNVSLNPTGWTENPVAKGAIEVARRLRSTKHGMYASVPIICKSDQCPYRENCMIYKMAMAPHGEKCPIEIAAIEDLFERYCEELGINQDDPKSSVDLILVRELVDIDISILRCDNKLAVDADFIVQNVVGMTEDQDPIYKNELHPIAEFKQRLYASRHKTFQLLNSTRKDKQGTKITVELDPSERAAEMLRIKQDLKVINHDEIEAEKAYFRRMNGTAEVIDAQPAGFEEGDE